MQRMSPSTEFQAKIALEALKAEEVMFASKVALVVDDSHQVSQIVGQLLRKNLNFGKVINAHDGRQALNIFRQERVDWIFSDFEMPEMSGLELLAAVRELDKGKSVPFVLMTSHADKDTFAKVVGAGATDFIAKPFNSATFIQKVHRIVEGSERRVAHRVQIARAGQSRIMFSPAAIYKADVVNISSTGCLLRTQPFHDGGTVYDITELGLGLNGKSVVCKALLVRMEVDRDNVAEKSMLAAFHLLELDEPGQHCIEEFLAQLVTGDPGHA